MKDATLEGEQLCQRQSIKFESACIRGESIYVSATSRGYGEIWVMRYHEDNGEHFLSERLFRFELFGDPDIPTCIIDDVARLHEYMRDRDQRGLGVDTANYQGVQ